MRIQDPPARTEDNRSQTKQKAYSSGDYTEMNAICPRSFTGSKMERGVSVLQLGDERALRWLRSGLLDGR